MKLSNINRTVCVLGFFLLIPLAVFCQVETFEGIQYAAPKDWARTPKQGAIVFTDVNKATNAFCILTVYGERPGLGDPKLDFAAKWSEWAVKPLGAESNPQNDSQKTPDGWQVVSAASQVEFQGIKSVAILTVISGYGKVAGVLAIFNDQSYLAKVQTFLDTVKMDKTAAPAENLPAKTEQGVDARTNDPFPDRPGYEPQKPLSGILKPSITIADLVGTWNQGAGSVKTYVDSHTGDYAGTNTTFYGEEYVIHANGTFDYRFAGRSSNYTVKEGASGTIILTGGFIELKFKGRDPHKYQFVAFNVRPNGASILTLVEVHDKFQGYFGADMQRECGHYDGYIGCVGGEQWARLLAK